MKAKIVNFSRYF